MIYEFYSIGAGPQDPLRSASQDCESKTKEKQIVYIGQSNSFSYGLHRFMSSVVDKVPQPTQFMELDLTVKGNTQTAKDGDCILIFVRAKERLFSAGVRAVSNVGTRGKDCKAQLLDLYGAERPALAL